MGAARCRSGTVAGMNSPYPELPGSVLHRYDTAFSEPRWDGGVPGDVVSVLGMLAEGRWAGVLLQNVPVGRLGATPERAGMAVGKDGVSEANLLAVAGVLGVAVGYAPEQGGARVQDIAPSRGGETRQVSSSSKVMLELHTEAAFHPFRPDYVLLLCLRGNPEAGTTLVSAEHAAAQLGARELEVLSQPRFTTGVDESYIGELGSRAWRTGTHPVFYETGAGLRWCLDAALCRGEDEEAAAALTTLIEIVKRSQRQVVLQPGDLLCVDNTRTVHGRTPYTPRYDGTDRWLQRAFVRRETSMIPSEQYRSGVITTVFV
jgi:L-asparagine oxygenase